MYPDMYPELTSFLLIQKYVTKKSEILVTKLIITSLFVLSNQICEAVTVRYKQWKDRQLRQRQRANYKRLWSHLPYIFTTLQLMVVVVIIELLELPKSGEQRHRSNFIKY